VRINESQLLRFYETGQWSDPLNFTEGKPMSRDYYREGFRMFAVDAFSTSTATENYWCSDKLESSFFTSIVGTGFVKFCRQWRRVEKLDSLDVLKQKINSLCC